jgi:hypothetical protein
MLSHKNIKYMCGFIQSRENIDLSATLKNYCPWRRGAEGTTSCLYEFKRPKEVI